MERLFRRAFLAIAILIPLSAPAVPPQQPAGGALSRLKKIEDAALADASAYRWLEELSDTIGPRLTASPPEARARQWALAVMQGIGLRNPHLELWRMRRGWQRGFARAELIDPIGLSLSVASYGWTGSTPRGETDSAVVPVYLETDEKEASEQAASWAGKILFVMPPDSKTGNSKASDSLDRYARIAKLAAAAGAARALAVIARDSRPGILLVHAGPVLFRESSYETPILDIAAEHQQLIERLLRSGKAVRMRLAVQNTFTVGPVESANVVGDIPGSESPDQVVILGAHLDSWDLGTGAIDDGYGVAALLGAVKAIIASGYRPRRTIRLVLFTGEEQGLLGSQAYVQQHRAELSNILCAFVLDWGAGPIASILMAGHNELTPEFQELVQAVAGIQPFKTSEGYLAFTDAYSFTLAGLPGLAVFQDSKDYTLIGHSAADTFDKVDARTLQRNTALLAATAFWAADRVSRIGSMWTPEKTAKRLADDGQRKLLELLGLWRF